MKKTKLTNELKKLRNESNNKKEELLSDIFREISHTYNIVSNAEKQVTNLYIELIKSKSTYTLKLLDRLSNVFLGLFTITVAILLFPGLALFDIENSFHYLIVVLVIEIVFLLIINYLFKREANDITRIIIKEIKSLERKLNHAETLMKKYDELNS